MYLRKKLEGVTETSNSRDAGPSRAVLLASVQSALKAENTKPFRTLMNLEPSKTPLEQVRAMSTAGTVFDHIVNTLNKQGAETPRTLGGIMDTLDLTQDQMHHIACFCDHGETITGFKAAVNVSCVDQHR
jgi:hypothetical protein